ncbi:heavy metal-associated domain-containing protein [Streptomyces sp. NPDC046977]|uniref:heavy-metal-associated domain-containing protein n=1 Tax=Streptomyces sp. NPDC046977 TaxID=3154703 RepID=UPI0033E438F2
MTEKRYAVTGMSCEHCVQSITQEVSKVPGVGEVVVDLAAHAVTVKGPAVDDAAVQAAITEAGFGVTDSRAA